MEGSPMQFVLRNLIEIITGLLTVFFTVLVFLQVLFRYVFRSPITWSEELTILVFQWSVFLGAAIAVRHGVHYKLDTLVRHFPIKIRAYTDIFASIIIGVVALTMLIKGYEMVLITKDSLFPTINVSYAVAYVAVPISGALIIIYLIPIFINQFKHKVGGKK
jgi:C4-dicarboxylate transporter DctQ subunit